MPSVWADNEEVTFTDDIPVDPSNVYELLMGALSEQGRAVVKFVVDGEDALWQGLQSYKKLKYFLFPIMNRPFAVIEAQNHDAQECSYKHMHRIYYYFMV